MTEPTVKDRIRYEIGRLKEDADAGKIEAFFCVRIDRTLVHNRLVPTVTVIAPDTATQVQVDTLFDQLRPIATTLREVTERHES
jgi:hypothetical protein